MHVSLETLETRKKWHNVFLVLKVKNCHPIILYSVKIFFEKEGEMETFSAEGKQSCHQFLNGKEMIT